MQEKINKHQTLSGFEEGIKAETDWIKQNSSNTKQDKINKQETLEEAIKQELENHFFSNISEIKQAKYFINFGAKWQQEQDKKMYSEEDMKKCWDACLDFNKPAGFDNGIPFNEFLKDLKK
jgi:hypothetical protein